MRLIDADALINDILTDYGCDPKYIADETIDGLKPYTDQLILERVGLQPTIAAPRWVRCEEELPDNTRDVLAVRRYGENMDKQEVLVAHLSVIMSMEHGVDKWWNKTNITHWMDFPEPPKEG